MRLRRGASPGPFASKSHCHACARPQQTTVIAARSVDKRLGVSCKTRHPWSTSFGHYLYLLVLRLRAESAIVTQSSSPPFFFPILPCFSSSWWYHMWHERNRNGKHV